jgi:Holliday junction resolvase RusA-like endonuclease
VDRPAVAGDLELLVSITFLHARPPWEDRPVPGQVDIVMEGKPVGKARPRFGAGGHVYTPTPTKLAEARLIDAWQQVGSPRLDGAIHLGISKGHYRKDGSLSAAGLAKPHPTGKKPDADNAAKLVMDAMNGRLYRDDVDVIELTVMRYWSDDGWERTVIRAWELP